MKKIEYRINTSIETSEIIELYSNAGLPRPIDDEVRVGEMFANADLVISAWFDGILVGIARTITDFVWCSYLADLAVRKDFQNDGIGRKLVEMTRETVGEKSMLLLLSVPDAMEYYPKLGMEKLDNAFLFTRKM